MIPLLIVTLAGFIGMGTMYFCGRCDERRAIRRSGFRRSRELLTSYRRNS